MASDIPENIPGVSEVELANVAVKIADLPTLTIDDAFRFTAEVRAIAESRARDGWPNESDSDLAVFLWAPYPRKLGDLLGAKPAADLCATDIPILDRLFIMNQNASSGRVLNLPSKDPGEVLEWLIEQNLGSLTVVFIYRKKKLLVARPNGATGEAHQDVLRDRAPTASIVEIDEALKAVHQELLLTPKKYVPGVWEPGRSSKYIPGREPEKAIQRIIAIWLMSRFKGVVRVDMEYDTPIGRVDIRLMVRSSTETGRYEDWILLELKVIKSYSNAPKGTKPKSVDRSENIAAICEGIKQAHAYGKKLQIPGYLEVFDMRTEKDKSSDVFVENKTKTVLAKLNPAPKYRTWLLYGSASAARNAGWLQ